jgi:hypothetical protein
LADLAGKLDAARLKVNTKALKFLPDLCNLIIPGATVPDGFGGETQVAPVVHRNIPCKLEPLGRSDLVVGGAQITTQSHKLTMGANAITKQIKPHYQIVVLAHHNQAEQTFENPVPLMGSFDMLMTVAVTKV